MASTTGRDVSAAKPLKRRAADTEPEIKDSRSFPKLPRIEEKTDSTRWRLKDDDSRHTWHYLADDKAAEDWPQSYAEKWFLNLPLVQKSSSSTWLLIKLTPNLVGSPRAPQTREPDSCCEKWPRILRKTPNA